MNYLHVHQANRESDGKLLPNADYLAVDASSRSIYSSGSSNKSRLNGYSRVCYDQNNQRRLLCGAYPVLTACQ